MSPFISYGELREDFTVILKVMITLQSKKRTVNLTKRRSNKCIFEGNRNVKTVYIYEKNKKQFKY